MSKFLFIFVLFFLFAGTSYAQEGTISATLSTSSAQTIDYALPYPGLLPDSPLYFLKAIRDRVQLFLIGDLNKKAEYELIQADKRLNAALYLSKAGKEKYELSESTVSKAENYLESSIDDAYKAKEQKIDVRDLSFRLLTSSKKHQEVIGSIAKNVDSDTREKLEIQLKRAKELEKRANRLLLSK